MAIRCRFVDSISATPTVRLDLNDVSGAGFWLGDGGLQAPPPSLRRAEASTILRDGSIVAASAYDNRVVTVPLTVTSAVSMDARNTLVSSLVKELNLESNILEYRPDGSSTSYFFRTFRSPEFSQVMWLAKQPEATVSLNLYAEPFAYGLRVDVGPTTVAANPASANGCYMDVSSVSGDVETPGLFTFASTSVAASTCVLAVRRHGTPSSLQFAYQAESATMGTDTAVSGSTDATASGAGNNYAITTFVSTTANRLTWAMPSGADIRGTYRAFLRVKKSVLGDTMSLRGFLTAYGSSVTPASNTSWQFLDLGLFAIPGAEDPPNGYSGVVPDVASGFTFTVEATRSAGTGTLSYDYLLLVPADENFVTFSGLSWQSAGVTAVLDGPNDAANNLISGLAGSNSGKRAGSIPLLRPGSNRIYFVQGLDLTTITQTSSVTASYWPRWLVV